jgi:gas vesicle protein
MNFIIGFIGGVIVGAIGAVAYSAQTGKDLRVVADEIRTELSERDLDAIGARLEGSVSEIQKELANLVAVVNDRTASMVGGTNGADAVEQAADAVADAKAAVEDATGAA